MYDSVTVADIPSDAQYAAGYVNGSYANLQAIKDHCPHLQHLLTIDVNGSSEAECLDVEPGDAVASQVPDWVRKQKARGVQKPVIYTSASNVLAVIGALHGAGLGRNDIRLWTAHYIGEHICNPNCGYGNWQADGTQWTSSSMGRNLDQSLLWPSFFGPPPDPDPHHYLWFSAESYDLRGEKIPERATVQQYDKLRVHPVRNTHALHDIRDDLSLLAHRVLTVAHEQPEHNGKPSWGQFHRGWRYQGLIKRAEGHRLA